MTLKNLFIKIIIIAIILIILFIVILYFSLRPRTIKIANKTPYTEIIGTQQTTKQVCFIASNYEHFVHENQYKLQLENRFYSEVGPSYEIPIGAKLTIQDAKGFYNAVSGHTSHQVLGEIFVPQLNKMVPFEYTWEGEKPLEIENYDNYLRYPLTPWQEEPIPLKFSIENNSATSYNWPMRSKNRNFNTVLKRIYVSNTYRGNRDFKNTSFDESTYEHGMNYYIGASNLFSKKELRILKLTNVYDDILDNTSSYVVGNDHRFNLSNNFISLILTYRINKDIMESNLVNYDSNGNYIDHVMLSKAHRLKGSLRTSSFDGLVISTKSQFDDDPTRIEKLNYAIMDDGKIVLNK